jgi:hypothetical protein
LGVRVPPGVLHYLRRFRPYQAMQRRADRCVTSQLTKPGGDLGSSPSLVLFGRSSVQSGATSYVFGARRPTPFSASPGTTVGTFLPPGSMPSGPVAGIGCHPAEIHREVHRPGRLGHHGRQHRPDEEPSGLVGARADLRVRRVRSGPPEKPPRQMEGPGVRCRCRHGRSSSMPEKGCHTAARRQVEWDTSPCPSPHSPLKPSIGSGHD